MVRRAKEWAVLICQVGGWEARPAWALLVVRPACQATMVPPRCRRTLPIPVVCQVEVPVALLWRRLLPAEILAACPVAMQVGLRTTNTYSGSIKSLKRWATCLPLLRLSLFESSSAILKRAEAH